MSNRTRKPDGTGKVNDARAVAFNPEEGFARILGATPAAINHLQRKAEEMLRNVAAPSTTPEYIQRAVSNADPKRG